MTRPTKILILSIEFILAPTFTYLVVARLGVGLGAFIISGIAWALLLFSIRLFDSFTEDESPEESKAIETKRDTVISISLKDGKRITEIVNQTIKTL